MKLKSSHLRMRGYDYNPETSSGFLTKRSSPFPTVADNSAAETTGPGAARTAPGKLDVYFAAAVFACFALIAVVFSFSLVIGEWLQNKWRATRAWLTVHRQCSWCTKHVHYAPFGSYAWTTHTICPSCLEKTKAQMLAMQPTVQIPHRTQTGTTL